MTKLFSYVVEHDHGYAPNPFDDYCTLAMCKFGDKRRNIVELAQQGDWIIGTGGVNINKSAGHGKLIYVMRVDEKLSLNDYNSDKRFQGRLDNEIISNCSNRYVLISSHYFYFGRNAININQIPMKYLGHPLEKKGPRYRSDFSEKFITDFAKWLENSYEFGIHGLPCAGEFVQMMQNIQVKKKNLCS